MSEVDDLKKEIAQLQTVIDDLAEERDELASEQPDPGDLEELDGLKEFVQFCADDFPCDDLAHKYAATCRTCKAKELLG